MKTTNQHRNQATKKPPTVRNGRRIRTSPLAVRGTERVALDPVTFPDQPRKAGGALPSTTENILHLYRTYGFKSSYDPVLRCVTLHAPGHLLRFWNFDLILAKHLLPLATLNGLDAKKIPAAVQGVATELRFLIEQEDADLQLRDLLSNPLR